MNTYYLLFCLIGLRQNNCTDQDGNYIRKKSFMRKFLNLFKWRETGAKCRKKFIFFFLSKMLRSLVEPWTFIWKTISYYIRPILIITKRTSWWPTLWSKASLSRICYFHASPIWLKQLLRFWELHLTSERPAFLNGTSDDWSHWPLFQLLAE